MAGGIPLGGGGGGGAGNAERRTIYIYIYMCVYIHIYICMYARRVWGLRGSGFRVLEFWLIFERHSKGTAKSAKLQVSLKWLLLAFASSSTCCKHHDVKGKDILSS